MTVKPDVNEPQVSPLSPLLSVQKAQTVSSSACPGLSGVKHIGSSGLDGPADRGERKQTW